MTTRAFTCTVDELDALAIDRAIAMFQIDGLRDKQGALVLPEGESDLRGTILGEICRDWLENNGYINGFGFPGPNAKGESDDDSGG